MAVEHSPQGRGFYSNWPQTRGLRGTPHLYGRSHGFAGLEERFLAGMASTVPHRACRCRAVYRLKIADRQLSQVETHTEAGMPIVDVLAHLPKRVFAMGARYAGNGVFYIIVVFVLDYATRELGMTCAGRYYRPCSSSAAVRFFAVLIAGHLSDR